MDQLLWPDSFCGPPSPPSSSFSGVGNNHQYPSELDSQSCNDDPELWLAGGCDVVSKDDDAYPTDDAGANQPPAPPMKPTRRGRKRGTLAVRPPISHVEAERLRRDRLNRRFCDLRAAVPRVSRMDKASLLEDAVIYIAELRGRIEQLEKAAARRAAVAMPSAPDHALEASMTRPEAAVLRLQTATAGEPQTPARVMTALRTLDLPVYPACMCRLGGATMQDIVVDVPPSAGLQGEGRLGTAAHHGLVLHKSG